MLRRTIVAVVTAAALSVPLAAAPAVATSIGREGCTPGYWKNHTDNWEEAAPTDLFSSVFSDGTSGALLLLTLEQALAGGGGSGVAGAERILARAAVAAYLNAAHEDVGYPWRRHAEGLDGRAQLVDTVVAALESGSRDQMLALASQLDADNNLGCPLN